MSTKVINVKIQHLSATATTLRLKNPMLLKGEIIYESDTGYSKLGDGQRHWNDLPYCTTPGSVCIEFD